MTFLDALMKAAEGKEIHVRATDGEVARTIIFAFTEDGSSAFLSEVATEELVPLMEEWCRKQRVSMVVM